MNFFRRIQNSSGCHIYYYFCSFATRTFLTWSRSSFLFFFSLEINSFSSILRTSNQVPLTNDIRVDLSFKSIDCCVVNLITLANSILFKTLKSEQFVLLATINVDLINSLKNILPLLNENLLTITKHLPWVSTSIKTIYYRSESYTFAIFNYFHKKTNS